MISASPFEPYLERSAHYPGIDRSSLYLNMRDGVRLAMDVYLPRGLPTGVKLPTLLIQTRYWRSVAARPPISWFVADMQDLHPVIGGIKKFFVQHGYAIVYLDVRGTGASTGVLYYPWQPACLDDAYQVVDWIVSQTWSNGKVGGLGVSYMGTTAELLAATGHPAVKAVVPMFNHPDPYTDITLPGGLFNARFIREWSEMDVYLDRNSIPPIMGRMAKIITRGVSPVQSDTKGTDLASATLQHRRNGNAFQITQGITYRDEANPDVAVCIDDLAIHHHRQRIEESGVAAYGWASWLDGGTADAALRRFNTYPHANHVVIGAWNHGGMLQASPYLTPKAPVSPEHPAQWTEMLRFFDAYLLDADNGVRQERIVYYYTLGSETWQKSDSWPPAGMSNQALYLAENGRLSSDPPKQPNGVDQYTVSYQASSGDLNRWWELGVNYNKTVVYNNRRSQTPELLVYLSDPLDADCEISGYPILTLFLRSSETDGAFIAYLEAVAPSGEVRYLTEGELRAIHRQISSQPSPYALQIPYHSFRKVDSAPLEPGQIVEISFGMQPVSALIRQGHRLRLSLAGHDEGTFPRIATQDAPVWEVQRNPEYPSFIDLPMRRS